MKKNKFPTITVRVTQTQRVMIDVLKNRYYINVSKAFRDFIEKLYNERENEQSK